MVWAAIARVGAAAAAKVLTKVAPKVASRVAPAARSVFSKAGSKIAPKAATAAGAFAKIGSYLKAHPAVAVAAGYYGARSVSQFVASGFKPSAFKPTASELGFAAGSPFGGTGAFIGAMTGSKKGEFLKWLGWGKEKASDVYEFAKETPLPKSWIPTDWHPDFVPKAPTYPTYIDIEAPDYPDMPDVSTSFNPSVIVTPPDVTMPIQATVGLGNSEMIALAAMLGVPVAYLLGKKAGKRRKKYKRRKRKK